MCTCARADQCRKENSVSLSPSRTHRAPPQGVGVGGELLVELVLHQVHQEGGEDEDQEADVPRRHQLLHDKEEVTEPQCHRVAMETGGRA